MPTFTNKATLSYRGRTTESNTVTGTFEEALTLTKSALQGNYSAGSTVIYVVALSNTGSTPLNNLTLTDDLGGYDFGDGTVYPLDFVDGSIAYYVEGVRQPTPTVTADPALTVSGLSLPGGSTALLIYETVVNGNAPLDMEGTVTNTVSVGNLTASATVTAREEALLTITKSLNPVNVPENGALTYTFVIQNNGNTPVVATDNATVTDVFDPILTITSVTLNGAPLTQGTGYTYDQTTGVFVTTEGTITVPAATYTQQPDGTYTVVPGTATLTVTGTI